MTLMQSRRFQQIRGEELSSRRAAEAAERKEAGEKRLILNEMLASEGSPGSCFFSLRLCVSA
jgi:hypothetical protein